MPIMQSPPGAETVIDGRPYLYFAGTAYFALQGDPRVIDTACEAVRRYGVHSATSRAGFGESPALLEVERLAAQFFGAAAAFYFVTGYAGVSILMQSVERMFDLVAVDEFVHFSSQDGAAMSGARIVRFRHGDPQHLRDVLREHGQGANVMVLCDGVSPVLGDIAPVSDYIDVIDAHGPGTLLVDDAHGVGVLGSNGRGTLEHAADVSGRRIAISGSDWKEGDRGALMCGTLSKALGGFGGVIPGPREFIAEVKSKSRWFNGASAPAAPVAGATAAALSIVMADPAIRLRLRANVARVRGGLSGLGLDVADLPTPIVCVRIGDGANMARIQQALMARGIAIAHSRNYAGVGAEGALRIAVFSTHTDAMIDRLITEMKAVI